MMVHDDRLVTLMRQENLKTVLVGGAVQYITGDILDPTVCRSPFDVIIERRTVQNHPEDARAEASGAIPASG